MHTVYDKALEISAISMGKIGDDILAEELELYRRTRALASIMADGSIEETIHYIEMSQVIEADIVEVEHEDDKTILVIDENRGGEPEPDDASDPEEPEGDAESSEGDPAEPGEGTADTAGDAEAEEAEVTGAHAKKPEPEVKGEYRRIEVASPATLAGRDIADAVAQAKGRRAIITIGTSDAYSLSNRLIKELRGKVVALELL